LKNDEAIDKALSRLFERRTFALPDRNLIVACLLRAKDWRPLRAPWWTKREVSIIGADLNGNFFLRHSGGSVLYWDHATQTDITIADSIVEFCAKLE
jgi:hypothetical protein